MKKSGGFLGCCGAKGADVIEIDLETTPPHSQAPAPPGAAEPVSTSAKQGEQLDGLDGLSWAPLLLHFAPNKAELLLGLATHSAYSNVAVCDAVAVELCAHDPDASAEFVRKLEANPALGQVRHQPRPSDADVWPRARAAPEPEPSPSQT